MKNQIKFLTFSTILVVLAFIFGSKIYKSSNQEAATISNQQSSTQQPESMEQFVRYDSPSLGPSDARVTVVEFLDPECESCQAFYPTVKKVLKEFEGRVRFVVRYMPFHSNSILAIQATEAAGLQMKYWEMQEILFLRQAEWGHQREPQTQLMLKYASELGLDTEQFSASLSNILVFQKIERDRQDGIALGVEGTPTIFINGRRLEELNYESLKAKIELELK